MTARLLWARIFDREPDDWYAEAPALAVALFREIAFDGQIVDPACGRGAILVAADACGLDRWGSDLHERAYGSWPGADEVADFLADERSAENIVSNPPYDIADQWLAHALRITERRVALLLPLRWLASERRVSAGTGAALASVVILTPRPSIPPGRLLQAQQIVPSGGKTDYAWFVWEKGHVGRPDIRWGRWRSVVLPGFQ